MTTAYAPHLGIAEEIERAYRARTPTSASRHQEAERYLPGGNTRGATYFPPYPLFIARGEGCRLVDVDGNVYIDLLSNYTSMIHGHAHPRIAEAVARQLRLGTAYGAAIECQIELARALCERVPSLERVRFCNSGTEATLHAIRAAKAFTGRDKLLKMEGGYHGTHDPVDVSVAPPIDDAGPSDAPRSIASSAGVFRGVVADVIAAPFNDVDATRRIIERHAGELAAVIVEPVLGAAMIPASHEFLQCLRDLTREVGALLIFDEVITFRLARGGAQQLHDVMPDLTTLGKIIGGGLPVGAFGGREDVMAAFDPRRPKILHSGTFNGNAATMVAGLAALELLTDETIAQLDRLGARLRDGISRAFVSAGVPAQVTGTGSLANVLLTSEPVTDYRSAARARSPLQALAHLALLNKGVFMAPRGLMCVSTPMGADDVDAVVWAFDEVATTLSREGADAA